MNERKRQVVLQAQKLFVEKGYQATSIQEILEKGNVSKGTFYNYFPSKSELLKDVFRIMYEKLIKELNELMIGQNRSDTEVFVKQIELMILFNRRNNLSILIEEIFSSSEKDLKDFLLKKQMFQIKWIYHRFVDIYGEEKEPYLLDCAIMFQGIIQKVFHYNYIVKKNHLDHHLVARYCVDRIKTLVDDVAKSHAQLLTPDNLNAWLPGRTNQEEEDIMQQLNHATVELRKAILTKVTKQDEQITFIKLVDFIKEEILQKQPTRKFLLESALLSLRQSEMVRQTKEFVKLEKLVQSIKQ
ncbi:TetR/AcrR family transcriptional regulator [Bacillus massiliglaciei]|uniref:TetR/AcrR family transcriptional regulator n=1 Tax=Bacillus massiliglaciei TaxID=1816693 RepID=UPI000A6319EA|nr:TetR/AcrR family transcriptional regulator [Bacillus massiliglaciei]